jgi:SAM-dependent methyltransferase
MHVKPERQQILRQTEAYYTQKVVAYGATAQGADWNSTASQQLRFTQLLRLVEGERGLFSINDFGCGYGALVEYLQAHGYAFTYHGFDLSAEMLKRAQERYGTLANCRFSASLEAVSPAQYTVASGIFNVKLDTDETVWAEYMLATIDRLAALSTQGFAFNVLTKYSDPPRMRPHLYYADPGWLFDYCQRRHSRWVAVLHDYGLYEFTMLVRKGG